MIDAQTEELVSLRPSHLLFIGPASQFADISRLSPTTALEHFELSSLEDVRQAMARLAKIVEQPARGVALVEQMDREIQDAKQQLAGHPPLRVLFLLDSNQHGRLVAGPGTYLDDIIVALGLKNAGADVPGQHPWRAVDSETVLAAQPELLIAKPDSADHARIEQVESNWTRFIGQPGIALTQVRVVTNSEWTIPSAQLGTVATAMASFATQPPAGQNP